jgi:hypothetical protein
MESPTSDLVAIGDTVESPMPDLVAIGDTMKRQGPDERTHPREYAKWTMEETPDYIASGIKSDGLGSL